MKKRNLNEENSKGQNETYPGQNIMEQSSMYQPIAYSNEQVEQSSDSLIVDMMDPNNNMPPTNNREIQDLDIPMNIPMNIPNTTGNPHPIINHTKYDVDNMIKKFKAFFEKVYIAFINVNIFRILKVDLELLPIRAELNVDPSIATNRVLLNTPIRVHLSHDISPKFRSVLPDHNRQIIQILINNEYLRKILECSYLDFVKAFRGDELGDPRYDCIREIGISYLELRNYLVEKGHEEAYIQEMYDIVHNYEYCF